MQRAKLPVPLLFILLFPLSGLAQPPEWQSLGTNILPDKYRTWSLKIAEDNSMWVISTLDAFPPTGAAPRVHRSVDMGQTWTTSDLSFGLGLYGWDIAPIDAQTAFAALSKTQGLYKTTDGGAGWTVVNSYPYRPIAVHFFNETEGWVSGDSATFLTISVTSDGGQSWTHMGGENWVQPPGTLLPPQDLSVLSPSPAFSTRSSYDYTGQSLLVGNSDGTVYISHDKGYQWEQLQTPLAGLNYQASNVSIKDSLTFIVVSDTENVTYNPKPTVSFTTTDGGQNWQVEGSPGVTAGASHYIPGTDGTFIVSGHNDFGSGPFGTAISYDFGATWAPIDPDRILAIDFNSSGEGIASCCRNNWLTARGQVFLWDWMNASREVIAYGAQPFQLAPNPVQDRLQIRMKSTHWGEAFQFQVLGTDGTLLKTFSSLQGPSTDLDLSDLAPGMYLAKLTSDGQIWAQKFVKL